MSSSFGAGMAEVSGRHFRLSLRTMAIMIIAFLLPVDVILMYYENTIAITLQKVISGPVILMAAMSLPWRWIRVKYMFLLLCFFAVVVVSALAARYRGDAIAGVQSIAIYIPLTMAILNLLRREEDFEIFLRAFLFCTAISGLLAVLQSYTGQYYFLTEVSAGDRYGGDPGTGLARGCGLSNEINYFAAYQCVGVAIWFFLRKRNVIDHIAGTATTMGLIFSFSRMGLIVLFLICAWRAWETLKQRRSKIAFVVIVPIALVFWGQAISYLAETRVVTRFASRLTLEELRRGSAAERWELLRGGLRVAAENPLIGVGPRNEPYAMMSEVFVPGFSHNSWVTLAAENGIPAAFFFVAIVLSVLQKLVSVKMRSSRADRGPLVSGAILAAMVAILLGSMFLVMQYCRVFYAFIALAVAYVQVVRERNGALQ